MGAANAGGSAADIGRRPETHLGAKWDLDLQPFHLFTLVASGGRILSYTPILRFLIVCISVFAFRAPAWAIDCTKARSVIEQAICSDPTLAEKDVLFARRYFATLRSLSDPKPRSEKSALLESQRKYLEEREKSCGSLNQPELSKCLARSMDKRMAEIQDAETDELQIGDTLAVGTESLKVARRENTAELRYKGKIIASADDGSTGDAPFTIVARWKDKNVSAALISAASGGTMHCSENYVLESRRSGDLQIHDLKDSCMIADNPGEVGRADTGFENRSPPTPTEKGTVTSWDAASGVVRTRELTFQPKSGTKLSDLFDVKSEADVEPLSNEEFYQIVIAMTGKDKDLFLDALWNRGIEWDCSNYAACGHIGFRNETKLVSYSGCGLRMESMRFSCGDNDALAVIDETTGKSFFALAPHKDSGNHDNDELTLYPGLAQWTAAALHELIDWKSGGEWRKADP